MHPKSPDDGLRAFAGRVIVSRRTTDPDPRVGQALATLDKHGPEYAASVDVGLLAETYQFATMLVEASTAPTTHTKQGPSEDDVLSDESGIPTPAVASIFVETVMLEETVKGTAPRRVVPPAAVVEVSSPPAALSPADRAHESLVALVLDQVCRLLYPLPPPVNC